MRNAKEENFAEIGLLFVHGIGLQRRGDTLMQFGGPIYRWLKGWFAQVSTEERSWWRMREIGFDRTTLTTPAADADAPAHSRMRWRVSRNDPGTEQVVSRHHHWLLAESHWAELVTAPGFASLASWIFGIVPVAMLQHFGARVSRLLDLIAKRAATRKMMSEDLLASFDRQANSAYRGAILRVALEAVVFLWALLLGTALQVMLLLMLIVALIPLPSVRQITRTVQILLSGVLGDSQLFLENPILRNAIVERVRRDLHWIASRSKSVFVVAHSQGAAIVHELRNQDTFLDNATPEQKRADPGVRPPPFLPDNVIGIATLGAGINKLAFLDRPYVSRRFWRSRAWVTYAASIGFWSIVFAGLALSSLAVFSFAGVPGAVVAAGGALLAMAVVALCVVQAGWMVLPPAVSVVREALEWRDYYATYDLVPNGPIIDTGNPWAVLFTQRAAETTDSRKREECERLVARIAGVREERRKDTADEVFERTFSPPLSVPVHNLGSLLGDHTTYWTNADEFVTKIVRFIDQRTQIVARDNKERPLEVTGATARDDNAIAYAAARRRWRVNVRRWTRRVAWIALGTVATIHTGLIGVFGQGVVTQFAELNQYLSRPGEATKAPMLVIMAQSITGLLGVLVLSAPLALSLVIALLGWRLWDEAEMGWFFSRYLNLVSKRGPAIMGIGIAGMVLTSWAWSSVAGSTLEGWRLVVAMMPAVAVLSMVVVIVRNQPSAADYEL